MSNLLIESYFKTHDLYNYEILRKKCELEGVRVIESKKYPGLVMLHYNTYDVHFANKWTEFSRLCRGLIVDIVNKKIIAFPFTKFFNVNEQPETEYNKLKEMGSFEISEKLDGSMILIFKDPNTNKYVATTKGSFDSEHGEYATSIIPESVKNDAIHDKYTLIFELIDSKFQIVVNYEKKGYKPGLYLIGARNRDTGCLLSFSEVQSLSNLLRVPTFKTYYFAYSLDKLIDSSKRLPVLDEGYVIRFRSTGLLVKVKGTEYLRAHRFISRLSKKAILEALGDGIANELEVLAPEEYKEDVIREISEFKKKRTILISECEKIFKEAPKDSRKKFAIWVNKNVTADIRGLLFKLLDTKSLDDKIVYKIIGKREGVTAETHI